MGNRVMKFKLERMDKELSDKVVVTYVNALREQ